MCCRILAIFVGTDREIGMNIQQSDMDDFVVRALSDGYYVVDTKKGVLFGRKDSSGKRKVIGQINQGCKAKTACFYYNGRNRSLSVARTIWLSVHGSVPAGMRVETIKGGDDCSIDNLKLVEATKHFSLWRPEEVEILRSSIRKLSWDKISEKLHRSEKSCRQKARSLIEHKGKDRKAWTEEEDEVVKTLVERGLSIQEIAKQLGRTYGSIGLRAKKFGIVKKDSRHLTREWNHENFYTALKAAKNRGGAILSCCLCDKKDYKYCAVHHIDGNHKNCFISNQATLCPCCHSEVHGGEHKGERLYSIWRRIYSDGSMGEVETNLVVKADDVKKGSVG